MTDTVLATKSLTKRYGSHLAVDRAELTVQKGQIYGLVGRNGAGKTTIIRMITGQTAPTAGEICEALYGEVPHAREAFEKVLEEKAVAAAEPVAILPAAVRRMEHQKLKSYSGVEVKVPVEVYKDPAAVEFIRNEDGTTSLLIKNILV